MPRSAMATIDKKADTHRAVLGAFMEKFRLAGPRELVLIQPPLVPGNVFDVNTARRGGYFNFPPMGLLYIAAAAREVAPDIKIHLIDLNQELLRLSNDDENFQYLVWQDLVREAITSCAAPIVGITYMFGTTKSCFKEVSDFVRREFPNLAVMTGGVQAPYDYQEILRDGLCDIVFRKESETQFAAMLRNCLAGSAAEIPVGAAVLHDGEVYEFGTAPSEVPMDFDITGVYDLIDIASYNRYGSLGPFSRYVGSDKPFATALSNRGCRARCTFCTVRNFNGFGIRQRTVQNVIDEIKFLVQEKGIRYIDWLDDDLLWDPKRAVELFKGIAEQVPGLEWTAQNGLIAVAIDDDVMEWMVKSGLKAFKIGIESGNEEMLHVIKKPTTKPKLRVKRKLFAKYPEVLVSANFIIGFPNETFGQMMDSFDFACELEYDWSSFYICQPLKGTDMFSVFQSLGDSRTEEEGYSKLLNPARAVDRGEFGYNFDPNAPVLRTGWDVFSLPEDVVPDREQQKEIWFAFNFVCNFLRNLNFKPGGNLSKLIHWLESIHAGYPYDASMAATLAHVYRSAGDRAKADHYRDRFITLAEESPYWRDRANQFPEMFVLAGITQAPAWLRAEIPATLDRDIEKLYRRRKPKIVA